MEWVQFDMGIIVGCWIGPARADVNELARANPVAALGVTWATRMRSRQWAEEADCCKGYKVGAHRECALNSRRANRPRHPCLCRRRQVEQHSGSLTRRRQTQQVGPTIGRLAESRPRVACGGGSGRARCGPRGLDRSAKGWFSFNF